MKYKLLAPHYIKDERSKKLVKLEAGSVIELNEKQAKRLVNKVQSIGFAPQEPAPKKTENLKPEGQKPDVKK